MNGERVTYRCVQLRDGLYLTRITNHDGVSTCVIAARAAFTQDSLLVVYLITSHYPLH